MNIFRGLVYCRICGAKASSKGASFIKLLSQPCQPPGTYGLDNLKRLRQGTLPRQVSNWPCDFVLSDYDVNARIAEMPLSDFEKQVLSDHPELSVAEAKTIASTLLGCVEYAAQVVPTAR